MGQIFRLLAIQRVLIKYRLDEIIFATHLFRSIRPLQYLMPWNWLSKNDVPRAVRFRRALEELGPIYVKLGQILSTRRDFLPEDIAKEFAKLQDRVPPFPGDIARKIIEKAYGCKLEDVFLEFDEVPLASASIAQVHAAKLKDGREYIVKVIRPHVEKRIKRDLALIYFLAKQAERYYPEGRSLGFTGLVKELEKTLAYELDMKREAANASQLRRNFSDEAQYYVPEVHWKLTKKNVLVIERVWGISINDIDSLQQAGIDLKWLAEFGVEIFFTQVFRDNFFHADMHPGNIFVTKPEKGEAAKITVVDFGIMSSLTEFDQRYLAENFLAFLDRDYQRVAQLHIESGWVPAETRLDELEFAVRTVCEPLLDRPIREILFGELLGRLFRIAKSFNIEIMPQLILLQKTIINIEGIGRQLYPELDLWQTARPQMEGWMSQRTGIKKLAKGAVKNIPNWIVRVPGLPNKAIDLVEKLLNGKIELENKSREMKHLREEMRAGNRRTTLAIIGSGLLISAAIIYGLENYSPAMISGIPVIAWVAGIFGIYLILVSIDS